MCRPFLDPLLGLGLRAPGGTVRSSVSFAVIYLLKSAGLGGRAKKRGALEEPAPLESYHQRGVHHLSG